jgi:hypothetical protein
MAPDIKVDTDFEKNIPGRFAHRNKGNRRKYSERIFHCIKLSESVQPCYKDQVRSSGSSAVTIQIYDAAGRLIGAIVNNEYLNAGTKEVNFNASSSPAAFISTLLLQVIFRRQEK